MPILLSAPAVAQQAPDVGRILQNVAPQTPLPAPLAPATPLPPAPPPPAEGGAAILVKEFHIVAKAFPEAELQAVLQPYVGRKLTFAELQQAARKIDEFYLAHDRLARAILPPQDIKGGIVEIDVIEGKLSGIAIDPSSKTRLKPEIAIGMVADQAPVGGPVSPSALEGGIARLNEVPGVSATATMVPGAQTGDTEALIKVQDTDLVTGNTEVDNGGIRWSGRVRSITNLQVNDALGYGDQLSGTFVTTRLSHYGRVALAMPVNSGGLTFGVDASGLTYSLNGPFATLGEGGYAYTIGTTAAYPLFRSPTLSTTLAGTYDYKRLSADVSTGALNDRILQVATGGMTTTFADSWFGGALSTVTAIGTVGQVALGLDAGDLATDAATVHTEGTYAKLSLAASRLQHLYGPISSFVSISGQLSTKNLDSSEQMALGGPTGVRAYPANEAVGDQGAILEAELRWQATQELEPYGFYDAGLIQQHHTTWAGWQPVPGQPNVYELQGAGVGVRWAPRPWLQLTATAAHSIGGNPGLGPDGEASDGYRRNFELWLAGVATF